MLTDDQCQAYLVDALVQTMTNGYAYVKLTDDQKAKIKDIAVKVAAERDMTATGREPASCQRPVVGSQTSTASSISLLGPIPPAASNRPSLRVADAK